MTTLDDLLALLPDNSTGDIAPENLRTITTELWNRIDAAELRIGQLENTNDHVNVTGYWQVNPQSGAVPGGKQVTCDTGSFSTAHWLRFDPVDQTNTDLSAFLLSCVGIFAQQKSNAAQWVRYTAQPGAVRVGAYVQVPVTVIGAGGTVGSVAWQDAAFVIQVAA